MIRYAAGLVLLLFLSISLFAQPENAGLQVLVTDENDNPMTGAIIRLDNYGLYAVTGKDGIGIINNLPPGTYTMRVTYVGYADYMQTIIVRAGEEAQLTLRLNSSIIPLDNVEVITTRGIERKTPITFTNITGEELRSKTRIKSLPMTFRSLPSTNYYSENGNGIGYNYIRMRGIDQRRISVLINGIPQNDPEDHSVYWINFYDLASSLEDIQVQRGAGTAFYGPPSIGGSINLVTKNPSPEGFIAIESGYGSFNTRKLSLAAATGVINDHFSVYLRGSRVLSDGYRNNAGTEFWRFHLKAAYFDEKQSIIINTFGGPQEDRLAFYGIPKEYNGSSELRKTNYGSRLNDREVLNQPQISLQHDYHLSDNITVHNTFFFISGDGFFDFDGSWGTAGYYRLEPGTEIPEDLVMRAFVDNDHYGWLPQIEWKHSLGKLIAGAELRQHRSLHWGRIESGSGLPYEVVGEEADRRFYEYKGGKNVLSGYVNQMTDLSERLTLNTTVQAVYQTYKIFDEKYIGTEFTTPYFFFNPQAGINYNINSLWNMYSSVSFTMREPPLKNLYDAAESTWGVQPQFERNPDGSYDFDNPLVKPEKLLNVEFGTRFRSLTYRASAVLYWMEFSDEIVPSGGLDVFGQPRVGNAERTRHMGVEFEGGIRLFHGLDLSANLMLSRNRHIDFTEFEDSGSPVKRDGNYIANAPEVIANLQASYRTGAIGGYLALHYSGAHYTDNSVHPDDVPEDEVTVDPYALLNGAVSYTLPFDAAEITLSLDVHNILDSKHLLTGFGRDNFFPAAERNYFLQMKVQY